MTEVIQAMGGVKIEEFLFYVLAAIAIPMAYGVVFDRVIIRSGFLLIGVFGTIAGMFLLLQAQFLALAQLMIYAVGITLVVVIALMLTNPKLEQEAQITMRAHRLPGILMSILVFLTIYLALRAPFVWTVSGESVQYQNIKVLGYSLMTFYSLPFEFASVLLLAALMGAVMLAKGDTAADLATEAKELNTAEERTEDVVKA